MKIRFLPSQTMALFACICIASGPALQAQSTIATTVQQWADDPYFRHASVGVCVADATTGRILADVDAQKSYIPASTLKLLTTASALAILGQNYRYTTTLAYDGYLDAKGVLNGNLYIVGSGDPTLASPDMEGTRSRDELLAHWRITIQQAGIRQVTGRVIADDFAFEADIGGGHWLWVDMGNYYGCATFGLNFHENFYYLRFRQQAKLRDTPPVAKVEPPVPGLHFINEVFSASANSGDNAYIFGAPYTYLRHLHGSIPVGSGLFTIKGAIPDPPLLVAQSLTDALEEVGIICQRPPASLRQLPASERSAASRQVLDKHYSPPLSAIAARTNTESVNLYAEALLRTIGRERGGEGSVAAGLAAIQTHWEAQGLDFSGVQLYDGSGMSPRNVLPAAFLCQLLHKVHQQPKLRATLVAGLPVAGRTGSLKNSLKNTTVEGKLMAKSGSLVRVRAYSGYVPDANGRMLTFTLLLNNYDGESSAARKKLLQLMEALGKSK